MRLGFFCIIRIRGPPGDRPFRGGRAQRAWSINEATTRAFESRSDNRRVIARPPPLQHE